MTPHRLLDEAQLAFVAGARRATLATTAPDGRPRLVPVCFVLGADDADGRPVVLTPLDDKPKAATDPMRLARVRDILERPAVSLLVDRWDEDWTRLGWVRLEGSAAILPPGPAAVRDRAEAIAALRANYPQYAGHALETRPMIRITITRVVAWGDLGA